MSATPLFEIALTAAVARLGAPTTEDNNANGDRRFMWRGESGEVRLVDHYDGTEAHFLAYDHCGGTFGRHVREADYVGATVALCAALVACPETDP